MGPTSNGRGKGEKGRGGRGQGRGGTGREGREGKGPYRHFFFPTSSPAPNIRLGEVIEKDTSEFIATIGRYDAPFSHISQT